MAKYIDEESFEEIVYDGMYHADYVNALSEFEKKAVDAVPVVRCRDCAHYDAVGECNLLYYCDGTHREVNEQDFCSYGKRREDISNG